MLGSPVLAVMAGNRHGHAVEKNRARFEAPAMGQLRMRNECQAGRRIVRLPFHAISFRWTARAAVLTICGRCIGFTP